MRRIAIAWYQEMRRLILGLVLGAAIGFIWGHSIGFILGAVQPLRTVCERVITEYVTGKPCEGPKCPAKR